MCPGVSLGVLGYPGVSWGNQTDPDNHVSLCSLPFSQVFKTRPRGYKTFSMLNSAEHEILNVRKYKNIKKFSFFRAQISLECFFPAHKC